MFGRIISAVLRGISALSFHRFFAKLTVSGRKAARVNRQPGTPVPASHHFNWRVHSSKLFGRPAWTYRGARRNAMKNTRKAVA